MKGGGNKFLNTLNRFFGLAVEKAMPVVLKVALGTVGVLFVTALVLIYSGKRFGDGWEHPEAMAYMFQRAAETYCENASEYTKANGGKPWKYVLLAHDKVDRTSSFDYLVAVG